MFIVFLSLVQSVMDGGTELLPVPCPAYFCFPPLGGRRPETPFSTRFGTSFSMRFLSVRASHFQIAIAEANVNLGRFMLSLNINSNRRSDI